MARSMVDQNEKEIKKLIYQLTGFQDYEENFGICLQFALSNLKFHRYLSVDSHKVTRSLDGVCEKFRIHSEEKKYQNLKELSEKFLEVPEFEQKEVGKTDTHYSILSFLLLLADSPVKNKYVETPKVQVPEIIVEFDWAAYLLEGIERYEPEDEELSDWTDEEDTLEDIDIRKVTSLDQNQKSLRITHPDNQQIIQHDGSMDQWEESSILEGADWLSRNLVAQYWKGEKMEIELGHYRACQLNNDWQVYKEKTATLSGTENKTVVTELVLLREVVWMLMGLSKLYLLEYNGRYYTPRQDLSVPHLTEEVLYEFLNDFTRYGSYIRILNNFVKECYPGNSSKVVCHTYQAFGTTVADFMQKLKTELSNLEHRMIQQEEVITLQTLARDVKPLLRKVGIVYVVYMRGIHQGRGLELQSQKATLLLTMLYKTLIGGDTLSEVTPSDWDVDGSGDKYDASEMVTVLLPMWIQTIQPYINIIDNWISHGIMTDPCREFIIQRNKDISTLDETYWEKSFAFHTMGTGPGGGDRDGGNYNPTDWAPKFLQPVLQQIVLTGKSMEMLEGLGKLAEHDGRTSIDNSEFKEGHLYEKFISSLLSLMGMKIRASSGPDVEEKPPVIGQYSEDIERQMKEKGIYDNFLKQHFEKLLQRNETHDSILDESFTRTMEGLDMDSQQPVELILQACLYPHIQQQYDRVCLKLVNVLKTDLRLLDYLSGMRKFFLMEEGDAMFRFYTEIFDKIRLHEHWKDTTSVTWALHEAVGRYFPDEQERLAVLVEAADTQKDVQPISVTNCLKLHYVIPSPVDAVINERCQLIYNQIFSFLLQIKRAKYALDELRFCDLSKKSSSNSSDPSRFLSALSVDTAPRPAKIHGMHLLRMRLINFVNSLHNYIMTRILHSTGLEFTKDLETAMDLDQIIEIHAGYVRKIHERCLLHRKNKFLKEAVLNMLNLALRFQKEWDQGIDQISSKQIEDMNTEFSRCIQFLSSFLRSVLQRGSFPHLESLALGLQNLTPS